MPIKPIDIMKSQEASQFKQMESQRIQHDKVQVRENFQNMIKEERYKTGQTLKTDNKEFRYDAKEKGQNSYFGNNSGKQKKEEKKDTLNKKERKTGGIDILI